MGREAVRQACRALIAVGVVLAATPARAQPPGLDRLDPVREAEPPYVDVVTFGVGDRIFEKFGHAAICLRYHDPQHVPICFNFGVTNFDAGAALVWGFVRGAQEFWVEAATWGATYAFYTRNDRDIWVQTLPLTRDQARTVEARLWASLAPGNRSYTYDHFFDNCTTRIRDLVDDVTGGALRVGGDAPSPRTFRELGRRGLAELPALVALADFVLGRQLEERPTTWEAMFHPDQLRAGIEQRLGVTPRLVYQRTGPAFPVDGPVDARGRLPMLALALAFALPVYAFLARALRRRRRVVLGALAAFELAALALVGVAAWPVLGPLALGLPVLAAAVFALAVRSRRGESIAITWAALYLGLWGVAIWGLAIVSPIPGVRWNEAVLVLVPLDLALPVLRPRWRQRYVRVRVVLLLGASIACAVGLLQQPLWIPIATALLPLFPLTAARPGIDDETAAVS